MGWGDWTQTIRLGCKDFYPLSHLVSWIKYFTATCSFKFSLGWILFSQVLERFISHIPGAFRWSMIIKVIQFLVLHSKPFIFILFFFAFPGDMWEEEDRDQLTWFPRYEGERGYLQAGVPGLPLVPDHSGWCNRIPKRTLRWPRVSWPNLAFRNVMLMLISPRD